MTFLNCPFAHAATAIAGLLSSISESSVPSVATCNKQSAAWYLITPVQTVQMSYSMRRSHHLTGLSVALAMSRTI